MNPVPVRFLVIFRGYRSNIFNSDPRIEIFLWGIGFWVPIRQVTDLEIIFRSIFFYGSVPVDQSFWCCCLFGSAILLFMPACGSWRCVNYFLVLGDYRCPRPGLDFLCFLQVGDTGSQPTRRKFFYMASGSVNFLWIPKALFFFSDPYLFIRLDPLLFTTIEISAFIDTSTMCHSTRSRRRRRRRAATPVTTPTRRTWTWRGRRTRTTPSRPRMTTRWTRTKRSSRGGPPPLRNPVVFRTP